MADDQSFGDHESEPIAPNKKPRTLAELFRARMAERQRATEQAHTSSDQEPCKPHDLSQESVAREKVAYIERARAQQAAREAKQTVEKATEPADRFADLKAHWENALRSLDQMEQTHAQVRSEPSVDEVEKLRNNLDRRLKQALIGLSPVQSHDRER